MLLRLQPTKLISKQQNLSVLKQVRTYQVDYKRAWSKKETKSSSVNGLGGAESAIGRQDEKRFREGGTIANQGNLTVTRSSNLQDTKL